MSVTSSSSNRYETPRSAKKPWRAKYARTSSSRPAPFRAISTSAPQPIERLGDKPLVGNTIPFPDLRSHLVRPLEAGRCRSFEKYSFLCSGAATHDCERQL